MVSKRQTKQAVLAYAVFRWESAAVLAMTLILAVFVPDPFRGLLPFWRWWIWVLMGIVAEGAIVATTMADPDVRVQIASQAFRTRFDLEPVADVDDRQKLAQAFEYREQMERLVQRVRPGLRQQIEATAEDVGDWIAVAYELVRRLEQCRERVVAAQGGPAGQPAQLEEAVQNAEGRAAESWAAMERIYAQVQLLTAQGDDSRRLRPAIAGQVRALREAIRDLDACLPSDRAPGGPSQ
jgi:hypothetical protein